VIRHGKAERRLRELGVIQSGEFYTATDGIPFNTKVNLDVMYEDPELFEDISATIAKRLKKHKPEIVIPVPDGANRLGKKIGEILAVEAVIIRWANKEYGNLGYLSTADCLKVQDAGSVAIVEDVSRTDTSMSKVANLIMMTDKRKSLVGAVVWDRDPLAQKNSYFPVERYINRYVPLNSPK
jgi:orotate phosphoribosyltransferase